MTEAYLSHKNGLIIIRAKGHAGYCRRNDIVCAGISTLTQTAAYMFFQMDSDGELADLEIKVESGDVEIKARPYKFSKKRAMTIYQFAKTGLKAISEEYPENLKFLKSGEK